jgi:hypothetical protein
MQSKVTKLIRNDKQKNKTAVQKHLGEPLRCIKIAAPCYGCGYFISLASGYPLHHLHAFGVRWFRYYPSRLRCLRQRIKLLYYKWYMQLNSPSGAKYL